MVLVVYCVCIVAGLGCFVVWGRVGGLVCVVCVCVRYR